MKNKKYISVIISMIMIFTLVGCSSKKDKTITTSNGVKYTQSDIDKEAIANTKLKHTLNVKTSAIGLVNGYFTGTIKNTNTDVSVRDITIDMGIYDSSNNKLGDEYIYVGEIDCGETYKINQSFYSYKYKGVTSGVFKVVNEEVNINELN